MLTGLSVRNIVLIERLDLTFDGGLSVLTGSRCGKSILLTHLAYRLGQSRCGLVRNDAQATVTAIFDVQPGHAARTILAESGIDDQEDTLIYVELWGQRPQPSPYNDRPVIVATTWISESLLSSWPVWRSWTNGPATHRDALDVFGGLSNCATMFVRSWNLAASGDAAAVG